MILQNWWYTTLLTAHSDPCAPLQEDITSDFLVIGGGMAGMHAALFLAKQGKKVTLLERNVCGGSTTGKSAGFLTPDSELELSQLLRRYGTEGARTAWSIPEQGVRSIVESIREYGIVCDLQEQDSLYVGIGNSGRKAVLEEMEARNTLQLPSTLYPDGEALKQVNTGIGYGAGIRYGGTFGINPLLYGQGLKNVLLRLGVRIHESTEVTKIEGHTARTHLGSVTAEQIIVCIDKMKPAVSAAAEQVYNAQTFLSISEPLEDKDIRAMFPGKSVMCWDSHLVYSYYRLTGDRRLLLGGGSMLTTFSPSDVTRPSVILGVIGEFKKRFPALRHLEHIQYWPGRIDTTKDLIPVVDFDPKARHIQYVLGAVGLPWAAFCGSYAARRVLEPGVCHRYCGFLRMNRKYLIPLFMQRIVGKMFTFSMNNAFSKYIQKDAKKDFEPPHPLM